MHNSVPELADTGMVSPGLRLFVDFSYYHYWLVGTQVRVVPCLHNYYGLSDLCV